MTKLKEKIGGNKFLIIGAIVIVAIAITLLVLSGMDVIGDHGHSHD